MPFVLPWFWAFVPRPSIAWFLFIYNVVCDKTQRTKRQNALARAHSNTVLQRARPHPTPTGEHLCAHTPPTSPPCHIYCEPHPTEKWDGTVCLHVVVGSGSSFCTTHMLHPTALLPTHSACTASHTGCLPQRAFVSCTPPTCHASLHCPTRPLPSHPHPTTPSLILLYAVYSISALLVCVLSPALLCEPPLFSSSHSLHCSLPSHCTHFFLPAHLLTPSLLPCPTALVFGGEEEEATFPPISIPSLPPTPYSIPPFPIPSPPATYYPTPAPPSSSTYIS